MNVYLVVVLAEPINAQIERRFQTKEPEELVSDEPQVSSTAGATVGEPEISEGSAKSKEPAPIVSIDPGLIPDSDMNVDLKIAYGCTS